MKFEDQIMPYLEGKKFSNALTVTYDYKQPIPDRVSFLVELTRGTRVLHLGCLDHLPLIEEKVNRRQWLHKELTESAKECIGIDVDREAFDFVQKRLGVRNIFLSDFTKERLPQVTGSVWDYAILGELLEHIDNPVDFLSAIRQNYAGIIRKIVITVPNAWTTTTIRMAVKSSELINSDHRYWFTPYTLSKVMHQAGIKTEEIYFANRVALSTKDLVTRKLLGFIGRQPSYNFTYASSIVAIGNL